MKKFYKLTGHSFLIILFLLSLLNSHTLVAQNDEAEEIISFFSSLQLEKNGDLIVTEEIQVRALHYNIRRGIYRTIPLVYRDNRNKRVRMQLEVQGLTRNGMPEPWFTESFMGGDFRINFGNDDFLETGIHTYKLTYKVNRVVRFFDDFDEIYWNVTGNDWSFPILKSGARVILPVGFETIQQDCYTGYSGETNRECRHFVDENGYLVFESESSFRPGEGFTVAFAWPKGLMAEPTVEERRAQAIRDNLAALVGFAGFLVLLIYYFLNWSRVGRDPHKGPIVPQYNVPENLSPAVMRYLQKMGFDNKVFTAALIQMAVKGLIEIEEHKRQFALMRTEADPSLLSEDEKIIYDILFTSRRDELILSRSNHTTLRSALTKLQQYLKDNYLNSHFVTNTRYLVIGVILSLITLVLIFISHQDADPVIYFLGFWVSLWTFGCVGIFIQVKGSWAAVRKNKTSIFGAIFLSLFAIPFFAAEVIVLGILGYYMGVAAIIAILMIIILNVLFFQWMKAPTELGRRLMDKIEGFGLFLSVAERERIRLTGSPDKNIGLYEKYLPYAMALDMENAWNLQFSSVIEKASVAESASKGYRPSWYHSNRSFTAVGTSSLAYALSSSFSSAVSSSSSSSSGSGGGGSSGGGSGGGGGGGR
ncbi:MAG: DUF2207 domain-containing protein [Cyclobacteriaceae bacterium]|nr:DUF2207 domain-containing protein [Cyclobacteriaceae bacterium]